MAILINFTNPNPDDITLNIYRSQSPIDRANLPAPISTLTGKPQSFLDKTAIQGQTYYYIFEAIGNNDRDISRNVKIIAAESRGPGNNILKEGTRDLGFYDLITAADLMDSATLATKLGVSTGFAFNTFTNWLKIARNGKVLFVPSISFAAATIAVVQSSPLWGAGIVIEQNGFKYRARLMRGFSETDDDAVTFLADKTDTSAVFNMDTTNITCEFHDLVYLLGGVTPAGQRLSNKANQGTNVMLGNRSVKVLCKESVGDKTKFGVRMNYGDSTRLGLASWSLITATNTSVAVWPVLELIEG